MADCEETLRELEVFLDGELTPADIDHIRHHLEDCLDCLQVFDFHAELRMVIRAKCQEQAVPPGLLERVKACFGDDATGDLDAPGRSVADPPEVVPLGVATIGPMVLAAQVWHYWIGLVLAIGAVGLVIALAVGYLMKVERPRFPPNPDR